MKSIRFAYYIKANDFHVFVLRSLIIFRHGICIKNTFWSKLLNKSCNVKQRDFNILEINIMPPPPLISMMRAVMKNVFLDAN